ncbi:MAG: Hpt domain-containing protein [Deltaproteobacteria bacterium]|nr:Hpt domain-containing protein [Deltaproteobacteria bacterium]MBN2686669.1 Hpt domain-containing protein [Deltaproteobacteria bacterium]
MDIKQLAQELELEEDDCEELLDLFIETVAADINRMKVALQNGNAPALMCAAHSLKGAASNFNFTDISDTAAEIEKNALENNLETMSTWIYLLETLFNAVSS